MKLRKSKNKLFKVVNKFQCWDWIYIIKVEKQMLIQMKQYYETSNISEDDAEISRQIKWALKLLDIIDGTDDDYIISDTEGTNKVYININNWNRFFKEEWCDITKPIWKSELRQEKAWFLYHKLRMYYMRNWWN